MRCKVSSHATSGLDEHRGRCLVSVVTPGFERSQSGLPTSESGAQHAQAALTRLAAVAAAGALALTACGGVENTAGGGSGSDEYPSGAVEMPVGASAGGSSDLISRQVAQASPTSSAALPGHQP